VNYILGLPTFLSADLGFIAILLLSSFIFLCYPPSSLNGTQPKPATGPEVSAIWKTCMSKMWGIYPFPKNRGIWGPKTSFFRRFRDLTANLTAYIFRMKHGIDKGFPTSSQKCHQLWSTNGLKLDLHFTLRKFYFLLYCQASQTEISKRNSTNLPKKSRGRPSQKLWPKTFVFHICSVFLRLRDLMANIFWTKSNIDAWPIWNPDFKVIGVFRCQ